MTDYSFIAFLTYSLSAQPRLASSLIRKPALKRLDMFETGHTLICYLPKYFLFAFSSFFHSLTRICAKSIKKSLKYTNYLIKVHNFVFLMKYMKGQ